MKEPVGASYFFPAIPILNIISIVLLVSIIPAFLKTKIFTLMGAVVIIITGNFFTFVNMMLWRNNIRDIPIYSDIMVYLWSTYSQLLYVNFTCFSKFVWYMSRPGSAVYLYDNRRKINRIDAMILGVTFLILVPSETFAFYNRYGIFEDFGPIPISHMDMKLFLLNILPLILAVITSIVFNVLTLRNVLIRRRKGSGGDTIGRANPPILKHLLHTISGTLLMLFGNIWAFYFYFRDYFLHINDHENFPYLFVPLSEIMKTRNDKSFYTRFILDTMPDAIRANGVFYTSLPLIGIYLFVFFGLGAEARKMHRDNIKWLAQLLRWRQQGKEESGDTDTSQSYNSSSSQTKKFSATFKQVFSSNRSRGMTVVPFQIQSDISPGCLEKGVLDIRLTTPDKTNANYPPRHSKHKTLLHPPSPSSDTSIEEGDTEPHNATDFLESQRASFLPRFSIDSTNDIVETRLHSLPRPQCKPPLPPPSQSTNSIDNTNMEQGHPQLAPLPVPPPAYSSTTFPRARQSWI